MSDNEMQRATREGLLANVIPPADARDVRRWLKLTAEQGHNVSPREMVTIRLCVLQTLHSWGIARIVSQKTRDTPIPHLLTKTKQAVDTMYKRLENQPASVLISAMCYYLLKAESMVAVAVAAVVAAAFVAVGHQHHTQRRPGRRRPIRARAPRLRRCRRPRLRVSPLVCTDSGTLRCCGAYF